MRETSHINNIPSSPKDITTASSNSSSLSISTSSHFNETKMSTSFANATPTEELMTETKIILIHHQYFQVDANQQQAQHQRPQQ